jgi:hypothetical protein
MRRSLAGFTLGAAVVSLSGCGRSSTAVATFPPLGGTYAATFDATLTNAVVPGGLALAPATGTIALSDAAGDGSIDGSFAVDNPPASGIIAGIEQLDGHVAITAFGDPSLPQAEAVVFLRPVLDYCDFTQAVGQPIDFFVGGPNLSASGSVDLPCTYTNGQAIQTFPSTITYTVTGGR